MPTPGAWRKESTIPSHGGTPRTLGYQPALDGIRALAIVGVLVLHLNLWGAVPRMAPGGHLGVVVFFVLSGYLITTLLMDERQRTGTVDLPAFYARRAARLMPALLLLLAVHAVIWSTQRPVGDVALEVVVALFYLTSLVHPVLFDAGALGWTWSLSVEEHFYLIWPLALRYALTRARGRTVAIWCCGVVIVAGTALRVSMNASTTWHDLAYYSTPARMDALAVGCLAALALHGRRPAVPTALIWAALGTLLACCVVPQFNQGSTAVNLVGMPLVSAATVVVVLGVVGRPDGRPARLLAARPLVHLGRISYGLYLWNLLAGQSMRMLFGEPQRTGWIGTALGLALTFVAAELSYRWVEQPVLRRARDRIRTGWRPEWTPVAVRRLRDSPRIPRHAEIPQLVTYLRGS